MQRVSVSVSDVVAAALAERAAADGRSVSAQARLLIEAGLSSPGLGEKEPPSEGAGPGEKPVQREGGIGNAGVPDSRGPVARLLEGR